MALAPALARTIVAPRSAVAPRAGVMARTVAVGRGSGGALQHEAYDLAQDPHEIRPLGILPAELLGAADLAHGTIQQGRPAQELDRAAREALEALGYVE